MKILLINPPCGPRTIGLRYIARLEPLGLELIGAGVKNHDVRLVDMEVAPGDLNETLKNFHPDVVGITSEIVHVNAALEILRNIKKKFPSCLSVVGGHYPSLRPEEYLDPAVNLIVLGEGVETFREICDIWEKGGADFSRVAGLAIPDGVIVRRTAPRPLPVTLDHYPFPDRTLTAKYRSRYYYLFEKSVAAIRTSFGCTHHCVFCSVRVYSEGHFIFRSPELVFEEIQSLSEDFIVFCDDHSFLNPERMRRLAEMLLRANVKKRYFVYARADSIVQDQEVFSLWARAGLSLVMTGLEAVDEEALRRNGKQTSSATNEEAVEVARKMGFSLSAGFLVEPHFQREDFERIDAYARKRPSIFLIEYTPLTPFPGTPLYKKEREHLITEERDLFDLQHFVLPTRLSPKKLYRLMIHFYSRSVRRILFYFLRTNPSVYLSLHTFKLVWGLFQNTRAFLGAHRHTKPFILIAK